MQFQRKIEKSPRKLTKKAHQEKTARRKKKSPTDLLFHSNRMEWNMKDVTIENADFYVSVCVCLSLSFCVCACACACGYV